jgi:2-polyprenyl-3-methyl-5-hydroxy-6-metoxy-1,4-benzoquinol methylase
MDQNGGEKNGCPACGAAGGRLREYGLFREYRLKRCEGCGLQALDPQPDEGTLAQIYRREYYDAWGIQHDEATTRHLKRTTFERLIGPLRQELGERARLLDCGAATGYLMEVAAEAGMEPYGVELSEFGAACIAEKFGPERVFCGPFEQASFERTERDFFDVITMIDFIEHVRDPAATLGKAYRLLRPGGRILMLTPNAASLSRKMLGPRWLHYKVEHLFYFTPAGLSRCLERSGFTRARVGPAWKTVNIHYVAHQLERYPHPVLTPIVAGLHRIGTAKMRKALFKITFGEMLADAFKPTQGMVSP